METKDFKNHINIIFSHCQENFTCYVLYSSNWAESKVFLEMSKNSWLSLSESNEHDSRSLRVTNIVNFFNACLIGNVRKASRQIIHTHISECKIPKSWVTWAHVGVISSKHVSSAITHPHIIACISEYECGCKSFIINDPGI